MSDKALEEYQQAHEHQLEQNEARHILTRVNEARQAAHAAGMRWPFELLQNALDAGPRGGRETVTISLRHDEGKAVFEHDGAAFSSEELAALLSGGSSKEFGSEETTGRFGTGFLVTHVLAERTTVEGLLSVGLGFEFFLLTLDRGGNEDEILKNIGRCKDAIADAQQVEDPASLPSARFEYPIDDDSTLNLGINAFRSALPYLFGTRPRLGEVRLILGGVREVWEPGTPRRTEVPDGVLEDRSIRVREESRSDGDSTEFRILRIATTQAPAAAALVLLESNEGTWLVRPPDATAAHIYCQYPLRDSTFLPVEFVLDGPFEPDQERSKAAMNDADKTALAQAFEAATMAVGYATSQAWQGSHLLAHAAPSPTCFDPTNEEERSWWEGQLRAFAERMAHMPIVETAEGFLPAASGDGPFADFVAQRLAGPGPAETAVERMWPLVDEATPLFPPIRELAVDWSSTADGWHDLGLQLNRVTAQVLAGYVKDEAAEVDQLRVKVDPHEWLVRFIDVVGECWEARQGIDTSVLDGLLPNQNGLLCSPADLRRDAGVPEELKDICSSVNLDIRAGLLSKRLAELAEDVDLRYVGAALEKALPRLAEPDDILRELLDHLRTKLPEGMECSGDDSDLTRGTAALLAFLWNVERRWSGSRPVGSSPEPRRQGGPLEPRPDDDGTRAGLGRERQGVLRGVPSGPSARRSLCGDKRLDRASARCLGNRLPGPRL